MHILTVVGTYYELQNKEQAIRDYQTSLELNPNNQEVKLFLARLIELSEGNQPKASSIKPSPTPPPIPQNIASFLSPAQVNITNVNSNLDDEKSPDVSILSLKKQVEKHQKIIQEFSWIERFKNVDVEELSSTANNVLKFITITSDLSKISQKLNDLDEQILPLTTKQQKEEERLRKIQHILNNDNLRDYYIYFKTLFSSTYIGCGALASNMVVHESGGTAQIGRLLAEIVTQLPLVGIAGTIITKISDVIDKRYG